MAELTELVWIVAKFVAIVLALMLAVAYMTYAERKVLGRIQDRHGPTRVGPFGLLQPFADVFKLLLKEVTVPAQSNKFLFGIAPLLAHMPAVAVWAVVPFSDGLVVADINAGLLYVLAMASLGVYGII